MDVKENMQKYFNYKEQIKRLKKAIYNKFFLEAIFIEYAIIEDRAESILRYENNEIKSEKFVSIDRKLNKITKLAENKKSLLILRLRARAPVVRLFFLITEIKHSVNLTVSVYLFFDDSFVILKQIFGN